LITSSAELNSAVFLGTEGTAMTCIPAAFPAVTPGLSQQLFTTPNALSLAQHWVSRKDTYIDMIIILAAINYFVPLYPIMMRKTIHIQVV
jgi:hypothetical protein